jgi:phage tail sheath gpL-like
MELLPVNNDGLGSVPLTVYPLDDDVSGVVADGDITASGAQTEDQIYQIKVNEITTNKFQIPSGTTASAAITIMKTQIDATLNVPVIAGANTG